MKRIQNFIKRFKRELKDTKLLKRIPKKTVQSNNQLLLKTWTTE